MAIPFFRPAIADEEIASVIEVMKTGWLTSGPKAKQFEQDFSAFLGGTVEAVAVNSATAGLHLAAEACGIGPKDAVLVPTLTFTATAEVIRYLGAEVIFVDVKRGANVIDLEDAERRITPNCTAIMVVHFGGYPCNMNEIHSFAKKHGLRVIEDAAHALPAHRDGVAVGAGQSDACIFSFYANKTITTGEGGMLVTPKPEIAARARLMRTHGIDRDSFDRFKNVGAGWQYDIVAPGFKYNMTDVAAAIGVVQLTKARNLRLQRQQIATQYAEALLNLPLELPEDAPHGSEHSWHIFPVSLREDARIGRDRVIELLNAKGIGTSVHYRPLHQMTYWKQRYPGATDFPEANRYYKGAFTLPLFPGMTRSEVEEVVYAVRQILT